ncbi:MAG: host-nuclease inhibitor Gam family protein, partial [Myxococcaceae bacterium]|nr:host-nuclease inhibitor Gam family protein [Myxococcaceae bacterium]
PFVAELEAEDQAVQPGWAIRSVGEVDWSLERITEARRELAEVDEMERAAIERIRAKAEQLRKHPTQTVDFFSHHLRMWAEEHPEQVTSGNRKSRAFLHGRLGYRAKPLRLEVQDGEALLEWARHRSLIVTKVEPNMQLVRALFKSQGEVPAGCDVVGGDSEFYVQTKEE